ncbi:MAG: hypothetical protein ACP5T3_02455 [Candidatus Micrarchaeia archaeon]
MRIQTSLEFLVLLSVVASLALVAISAYVKNIMPQYRMFGAFAANSSVVEVNSSKSVSESPSAVVLMPPNTTISKASYLNVVFYNCSDGSANMSVNSASLFFQKASASERVEGIATESLPFVPTKEGIDAASIYYSLSCGNRTLSSNQTVYTFASGAASNYSALYSMSISNRSEHVDYPLQQTSPIIYTTQSTSCTRTNFWYQPLPIQYQCGTADAWEYRVFSIYCYYNVGGTTTTTTCIYPHDTQYNTSSLGNATYAYAFTLSISSPLGALSARMSSSRQKNPLMLGNRQVGYAEVENVSYIGKLLEGGVLSNASEMYVANASAYDAYLQAKENLYSVLNYYNTTLSYSQQIYQALYEYNSSAQALIAGMKAAHAVAIANAIISDPEYPFDYVINAYVENVTGLGNETMQYMGSVVNLFYG